ncbi:MAG: hypothetical protein ACYSSO_06325 [Planctomycetota bacterium]
MESLKRASGVLERGQLLVLRRRAMRAGVWFRRLPRIDRVLVDLTIRVAKSIRSVMLADSLLSVARKLEGLLESRICRFVREVGFSLVCKASLVACGWGNISAKGWSCDVDFARFLAVMKYNRNTVSGGII